MTMNHKIRGEWTKALRSGDYDQGRGALTSHAGNYCCLGVLCDLAVKAGVIPPPVTFGDGTSAYGRETKTGVLPTEVMEWAGIDDRVGWIPDSDDETQTLVSLNDSGKNFDEIADIIDERF